MAWYGIVLIVYGVFCLYVGLLKPAFVYNMKKLKIMEKMMGKMGLQIFLIAWGSLAIVLGFILG